MPAIPIPSMPRHRYDELHRSYLRYYGPAEAQRLVDEERRRYDEEMRRAYAHMLYPGSEYTEQQPFTADSVCDCEACRWARMTEEEREEELARRHIERLRRMEEEREQQERAERERERQRARDAARVRREVKTRGRTFGVEIECNIESDAEDLADAIEYAGVSCCAPGYTHEVMAGWKVISDASVEYGWEVVSPPLHWDEREQVETVCAVLESLGARAGSDCGLHVHHDVRDLNITQFKRLCLLWHDAQPLTNKLTARYRCDGQWSASWQDRHVERIMACQTLSDVRGMVYNLDRYHSMNLHAYERYGTVEIRQHEGTIDADEILAWVAYGQALINHAASTRGRVRSSCEPCAPADDAPTFIDMLPIPTDRDKSVLKEKAMAGRLNPAPYNTELY